MALRHQTYGKDRVRVMRVHRDSDRHEVRELTVRAMLEGDFGRAFTDADNREVVSTDTVKNVVNVVAREHLTYDTEAFCRAVAERFLDRYAQVEAVDVIAHETVWRRLEVRGSPHPHSFVKDGNGQPFATVRATRGSVTVASGISDYTFLKSTGSGWADYFKDPYTTLPETRDRICATSMEASWAWMEEPESYAVANATVLRSMLEVFAETYSYSVQDSLYRMGEAALAAVREIGTIRLACPNKHYLPLNFAPFDLDNPNAVFLPTDEPHGQIECTIGRV